MQIKKTQTNKQQFKPNQAMKAKKMTQKLTLLTFTALFIAFMFNACSDVTSPNENLGNEVSQLSSSETEMQDFRRFTSNRTGGGEVTPPPPTCSLSDQDVTFGRGNGDSFEDRNKVGTVSVRFNDGKIYLKATINDPDYVIYNIKVYISKNDIKFTGNQRDRVLDKDYDNETSTNELDFTLSEYGIGTGEQFNVAMHVNVHELDVDGNTVIDNESAWAGEKAGTANRYYFTINYSCPSNSVVGYVN